jgi:cell division protein FtsL
MYYNKIYCDKLLKVRLLYDKQMYLLVLQICVIVAIDSVVKQHSHRFVAGFQLPK